MMDLGFFLYLVSFFCIAMLFFLIFLLAEFNSSPSLCYNYGHDFYEFNIAIL
jgi:hypothetical protein